MKDLQELRSMLGERIRMARMDADLYQKNLARELGVCQATVSHWEKGQRDMTGPQIVAVCKTLGITPDFLLGFTSLKNQGVTLDAVLRKYES